MKSIVKCWMVQRTLDEQEGVFFLFVLGFFF